MSQNIAYKNSNKITPWAVTEAKIAQVLERLMLDGSSAKIIIFGSAVRGELQFANDLDLMVIEKNISNRYQEIIRLRKLLSDVLIPIDLVVTTEESFSERSLIPGTIEYQAALQGRVLYEAS